MSNTIWENSALIFHIIYHDSSLIVMKEGNVQRIMSNTIWENRAFIFQIIHHSSWL